MPIDPGAVREIAESYTRAWCSHVPERVASFYAEDGRIVINGGEPMVGREAIAEMVRGFYAEFPDLVVELDHVRTAGDSALYLWTLEGTAAESGNKVRVSGWEAWQLTDDGLVSRSEGRFDAADYDRQLAGAS